LAYVIIVFNDQDHFGIKQRFGGHTQGPPLNCLNCTPSGRKLQ